MNPPNVLIGRRADPETRAVLEDWYRERGLVMPPLEVFDASDSYDGETAGNGGNGDGDGNGNGGNGDGDGGDGNGGNGDGNGVGNGVGNGDGNGGSGGQKLKHQKGEEMRNGLKIFTERGGYYPYVSIGWVRRVNGDEFEAIGARVIRRFGQNASLADLAANGPKRDTELLEAAKLPVELHRLTVGRVLQCAPEAWAEECPKPKNWVDGEE